jgi:hypothetical protein
VAVLANPNEDSEMLHPISLCRNGPAHSRKRLGAAFARPASQCLSHRAYTDRGSGRITATSCRCQDPAPLVSRLRW